MILALRENERASGRRVSPGPYLMSDGAAFQVSSIMLSVVKNAASSDDRFSINVVAWLPVSALAMSAIKEESS
jgi:hypothetical protein